MAYMPNYESTEYILLNVSLTFVKVSSLKLTCHYCRYCGTLFWCCFYICLFIFTLLTILQDVYCNHISSTSGESPYCLSSSREYLTNFSRRLSRPWQGKAVVINSVKKESPSMSKSMRFVWLQCSEYLNVVVPNSPKLIKDKYFTSNIIHQKFSIINHSGEDLSCHMQNIYLSCKNLWSCKYQYLGDATIGLHKWMNIQKKSQSWMWICYRTF